MLIAQQPMSLVVPPFQDTYDGTGWHLLATDGTGYTTLAALVAAGKQLFSAPPPGGILSSLVLTSLATGTITPGSPFQFFYGASGSPSTAPSIGIPVTGSAMQIAVAGPVYYLWLQKSVATDLINIVGWG